jgi:hypothetical protein
MIDQTLKTLLNALDQMEDIPGFLLQNDYRGFKGNTCYCPVAVYLKTYLPDEYLTVGAFFARWGPGDEDMVVVPRRVSAFIADFDLGLYPALIKDHSEVGAYV